MFHFMGNWQETHWVHTLDISMWALRIALELPTMTVEMLITRLKWTVFSHSFFFTRSPIWGGLASRLPWLCIVCHGFPSPIFCSHFLDVSLMQWYVLGFPFNFVASYDLTGNITMSVRHSEYFWEVWEAYRLCMKFRIYCNAEVFKLCVQH